MNTSELILFSTEYFSMTKYKEKYISTTKQYTGNKWVMNYCEE